MHNTGQGKNKILIVKLGAIGDIVMMLPIISAARKQYPDTHITWLCGKIVEPILRSVEGIDRLIVFDEKILLTGNLFEKLSIIFNSWKVFFFLQYDFIICPYYDRRYKLLTLTARKMFYRSWDKKGRNGSIVPGRYYASENIRLLTGVDDSGMSEPVFPKIKIEEDQELKNILYKQDTKFIALVPGGAKNFLSIDSLRNWPVNNYSELASRLVKQNYKVVLLGSKGDEWTTDYFKGLDVINLIGKTSLPQLMFALSKIDLLISHDTGIFHLGKLFKTPTLALFGPTDPNSFCKSSDTEHEDQNDIIKIITLRNKFFCSPCYDGKKFANCKNNICMKNISVDDVYNKTVNIIRQVIK